MSPTTRMMVCAALVAACATEPAPLADPTSSAEITSPNTLVVAVAENRSGRTDTLEVVGFESAGAQLVETQVQVVDAHYAADSTLELTLATDLQAGRTYHVMERLDPECDTDTCDGRRRLATLTTEAVTRRAIDVRSTSGLTPTIPTIPGPIPGSRWPLQKAVPMHGAKNVSRDLDEVVLGFASDFPLDCAAMAKNPHAARLVSEVPGVKNHVMFHGKTQDLGSPDFRGKLSCSAFHNELRFRLPTLGELYGAAHYRFTSTLIATDGTTKEFDLVFETENPGLLIELNEVSTSYDGCDGGMFGFELCDVYVSASVALNKSAAATSKLPDPGGELVWSNAEPHFIYTPSNPTLWASGTPVGQSARVNIVVMDQDGDGTREYVKSVGQVLSAAAVFEPQLGAAGLGIDLMTRLIPKNGDDIIGLFERVLVENEHRWGTTATDNELGSLHILVSPLGEARSDVRLNIEEFPRPWVTPDAE